MRILIAHPRLGKGFAGPVTKPRHIPCEHVITALARDNPIGRQQAHAARLRKPWDNSIDTKIIFQLRHRTKEDIGVWRPNHRTIDHTFYPCLTHNRHSVDGAHHIFLDPLEIVIE